MLTQTFVFNIFTPKTILNIYLGLATHKMVRVCPCGQTKERSDGNDLKCKRCKQFPQCDNDPEPIINRLESKTFNYEADHESKDNVIRKKKILTFKQRWPVYQRRRYGTKVIGFLKEKPWRLESYWYHKFIEERYPVSLTLLNGY